MRVPRLFSDTRLAGRRNVTLDARNAHYAFSVLRLRAGASVTLFDGNGGEFPGQVESATRRRVHIALGEHIARDVESPLHITLAQAIVRGPRMDYCVQKATELGVSELVPLITARSAVRLQATRAARKIDHWRAVAVSACEQCGRNRVPPVAEPLTLEQWLSLPRPATTLLLPDLDAQTTLSEVAVNRERASVLVGPEGGLTVEEKRLALDRGYVAVTLGPRILRAETAAVAALAVLQTLRGDLAGDHVPPDRPR